MMIPNYKEVIELIKKGATIEAQEKIMELREASIEMQEENIELKEKLRNLEDIVNQKKQMRFESPFYFLEGDNVPNCARCWEVDHKAVHYPPPFNSAAGPNYTCPECKTSVIYPRK